MVRIGDPITLELDLPAAANDTACSPAMDDKSGLWVVLEAFRRASCASGSIVALVVVSTVQEEIGLRGAATSSYSVEAQVGIAVDVTHATDCPTIDKKQEGDVKLGGGPVIYRGPNMNPVVVDRLIQVAEKESIAYQLAASGRATGDRRQHHASQPRRRGDRTGEHSQPLHAQPGRDDFAGRHRPHGRSAGRLRRQPPLERRL